MMQLADFGTLHRAIVISIDPNGVIVEVPTLAPNAPWGPIPTCVPNLAPGEAVVCAQISTSRDTLIVIGRVPGRAPTIAEIATLATTLTNIQNAATVLTGRVTIDEGSIAANSAAITALQSRATTDEGLITGNTSAITALQGRATTDEASITALQSRATTDETNITATNTAVTALTARVTTLEDTTRVGYTRYAFQAADTAGITNQTTPQNTSLSLPVLAGATYEWEALVIVNVQPTPGCKITFAVPTGTAVPRVAPWFSGDPAGNAAIWHDVFDGAFYVMGGKTGGGMMSSRPCGGLIVGSTAGNFTIQYSQNVSDPSLTVFNAGSKLKLTRVA
jgi:hypothetical protein